eukprot:PhM_4_TR359/c0_g1_i1/m.71423/K11434/PRMT1; type I protein arginine methyltransferase
MKFPFQRRACQLMHFTCSTRKEVNLFKAQGLTYHQRMSIPNTPNTKEELGSDPDYYFDSYGHYGIHESMLKDQVRTGSYRDSMYRNPHLFKDKVVLDVGCGTGILSMFAARAGARKVYAVECSSIAHQARQIVKENKLDDVITILHGKLEEVDVPEKVDIIVSEWMGYFLIYESMLNSVLMARDKFGAPDVKLFPNEAKMFIAGIEDADYWHRKVTDWNDVYGLDFSAVSRPALVEPLVEVVEPQQICTNTASLIDFDLSKVTVPDLSFVAPFTVKASRDETIHAFVSWFDTPFSYHENVVLSTTPYSTPTHWKQTVFYLAKPIKILKGEEIKGTLTCTPNPGNHRDLDIRIELEFNGKIQTSKMKQDYRLR